MSNYAQSQFEDPPKPKTKRKLALGATIGSIITLVIEAVILNFPIGDVIGAIIVGML